MTLWRMRAARVDGAVLLGGELIVGGKGVFA